MVLAVNIAPQVPLPGITLRSSSSSSSPEMRPALVGGAALGVIHDGEVVALGGPCAERDAARRARAGIEHEPEGVGARQRHQRSGAGLVAAGDHDHGVAVMGVVADLETVGDDVARDEAVARGRRALRQRIRHRRRADEQAPARRARASNSTSRSAIVAHAVVAAMRIGPGAGDGDHRAGLRRAIRIEAGGAQFDARAASSRCCCLSWSWKTPGVLDAGLLMDRCVGSLNEI